MNKAKNKTVNFETASTLFKDATIEYAAETVEKVLTDIFNDK